MAEEFNDEMRQFVLTSIGQHKDAFCVYMEQHAHMEMWGYPRLAKLFKKIAMKGLGPKVQGKSYWVEKLQERLEYFNLGSSDVESDEFEWPRHDIQGMIEADLVMEQTIDRTARKAKSVGVSIEVADPVTANMFTKIAKASEKAIEELQAALSVIDETSIKMYRQNANLE